MSIQPRHIVAALVAAFMVGTIGGGISVFGGGGSNSTSIAESPAGTESDLTDTEAEAAAAEEEAKRKAERAATEFTAEAVKQGKRTVISGEGAAPGAKLVVQRKESSGWQDFPANATAGNDGSYSTYIITSRDGVYRVKDTDSDAASEPVTIKV